MKFFLNPHKVFGFSLLLSSAPIRSEAIEPHPVSSEEIMKRTGLSILPAKELLLQHLTLMDEVRLKATTLHDIFLEMHQQEVLPEIKAALTSDLLSILPISFLNTLSFSEKDTPLERSSKMANLALKIKDMQWTSGYEKEQKYHVSNCLASAGGYLSKAIPSQMESEYADLNLSTAQYFYWASLYAEGGKKNFLKKKAQNYFLEAKAYMHLSKLSIYNALKKKISELEKVM